MFHFGTLVYLWVTNHSDVGILKERATCEKAHTAKCPFTSNAQEHILDFFLFWNICILMRTLGNPLVFFTHSPKVILYVFSAPVLTVAII